MRYHLPTLYDDLVAVPDHLLIIGAEDENEESEEESEESEEETEENESEENEEESEESEEESEDDTVSREEFERVRAALRKERQGHRATKSELKKAQRGQGAPPAKKGAKQESDDERARQEAEREAASREEKIAAKLATKAVDSTIVRVAAKLASDAKKPIKFQDIDDVISLVNRGDIDVDQDDDDPSEIEVDEDSVREALKSLAKKKPHLLVTGTSSSNNGGDKGGKTGSKFGGKKGDQKTADEATLVKKYPALGRR